MRIIAVVTTFFLYAVAVAGETDSPCLQARRILSGKEHISDTKLSRLLIQLRSPHRNQMERDEASYLCAELFLQTTWPERQERAREMFAALAEQGLEPWKSRGILGLLRLRAQPPINPTLLAELRSLTSALDRAQNEVTVDAFYYLGIFYRQAGDANQAETEFRNALKLFHVLKAYHKDHFFCGLLTEKDLQSAIPKPEAKPKVTKPKKAKPENQEPAATYAQAMRELTNGRFREAIEIFQRVINGWPDHPLAQASRYRVAECHSQQNLIGQALSELRTFIEEDPMGPWRGQAHLLAGDLLLEHVYDPRRAAWHFHEVLALGSLAPYWAKSGAPDALPSTAELCAFTARDDQRDEQWRSTYPDAHLRLGILAFYLQAYDDATKHLNVSANLKPDSRYGDPGGIVCLADYARRREYPLPVFYTQLGDERSRFALFYACALARGWQDKKSFDLYDSVYRNTFGGATPQQRAFARFGMGEALFHFGVEHRPKAIAVYQEFLTSPLADMPIAPRALLALAVAFSVEARTDEAFALLERIASRYRGSEWAASALYQRAYGAYAMKEPRSAVLNWFQHFVSEYPRHELVPKAHRFIRLIDENVQPDR